MNDVQTEQTYEIVLREDGEWSNDIGDANTFDTTAEALDGIEQLRKLGDDWRGATYAVRVRGEDYPLPHSRVKWNTIQSGYVLADTGRIYVQLPEANQWGFSLHDDDQEWPGGLGVATSWDIIADDDPRITAADRERLQWILDEAAQTA